MLRAVADAIKTTIHSLLTGQHTQPTCPEALVSTFSQR